MKNEGRTAGAFAFEVNGDLDPVGDLDEGDAAVHAIVFAIEGHGAFDLARAGAFTGHSEGQGLRFGDTANGEGSWQIEGGGACLNDLVGMESDVRVFLGIEEILTAQFVVLGAAAGIDAGSLNLDVEHAGSDVGGGKGERGVPIVESSADGDGSLDGKMDRAAGGGDFEDGHLGTAQRRQQEGRGEENERDAHSAECNAWRGPVY